MPHLKQLLLCNVLLFMLATAAFTQEAKNALFIANGEYGRNMGALSQPVPEARELKSALESIGFNVARYLRGCRKPENWKPGFKAPRR